MKNLAWSFKIPDYLNEILKEYEDQNENPDLEWLAELRSKLLKLGLTKQKIEKMKDEHGSFIGQKQSNMIDVLLNALEKNEESHRQQNEEISKEEIKDISDTFSLGPMNAADLNQRIREAKMWREKENLASERKGEEIERE